MTERMSEEVMRGKLAAKLVEARKNVGYIQKTGYNEAQSYSYATAQRVYDKVRDELDRLGVATAAGFRLTANDAYTTKSGGAGQRVVVECMLKFIDAETGFSESVVALGGGSDTGDKAVMKANTSSLKYALTAAFLISWGDDPESDTKTDRDGAAAAPAKVTGGGEKTEKPKAGKKPTKSQATLAALLEQLAKVQTEEQLNAFKLEGNTKRGEMSPDEWGALLSAVRGFKLPETPAAPEGETK